MISIFGRTGCQWTDNAKFICELRGREFIFIDVNSDIDLAKSLKEDGVELPMIYAGKRAIGGYDELKKYLDELDELDIEWSIL